MKNIIVILAITVYFTLSQAFAEVGKLGEPNNVSRVIAVEMTFNRFNPSEINVKRGETIKFILKNISKKKHEFMIDTMDNLKKHAEMMRKYPDMEHTESNMVTVASGKTGELIWQFTEVGTIDFACPMHGHSKGMRGKIIVTDN
ncbi:MAG: hypothetical protein E4H07_08605 [Nitrosomonadales bacterium]|jgi:uncharacterized cupredoxin-like copper-binding protein|nr:MAG: hypothetical protein E4H07_08605 [Nitrosomonadales bacterium]